MRLPHEIVAEGLIHLYCVCLFLSLKPRFCPLNILPNLALECLQGWEDPLAAEFLQERDFNGFSVQVAAQAEEVQFQHMIRLARGSLGEGGRTDPASPRGYAGASNGMPEPKSDKEPPKDPKFHKNYS